MANETGDMKITGNFRRLIDMVAADAAHAPGNADLEVAKLEVALSGGNASVADIGVKIAPNKAAINARQTAYENAVALVRGSRNILKSSGASAALIADADTFSRKILGIRKSKKKEDDPNTPGNEAAQNHSASQQSYEAMLGNLRNYIEILKSEPLYNPTENKYKITALEAVAADLEAKNNAVSTTFAPLVGARAVRDEKLYTGEKCLCNLAAMVKAYVKAIHGAKSQYFKNINALSFKRTFR